MADLSLGRSVVQAFLEGQRLKMEEENRGALLRQHVMDLMMRRQHETEQLDLEKKRIEISEGTAKLNAAQAKVQNAVSAYNLAASNKLPVRAGSRPGTSIVSIGDQEIEVPTPEAREEMNKPVREAEVKQKIEEARGIGGVHAAFKEQEAQQDFQRTLFGKGYEHQLGLALQKARMDAAAEEARKRQGERVSLQNMRDAAAMERKKTPTPTAAGAVAEDAAVRAQRVKDAMLGNETTESFAKMLPIKDRKLLDADMRAQNYVMLSEKDKNDIRALKGLQDMISLSREMNEIIQKSRVFGLTSKFNSDYLGKKRQFEALSSTLRRTLEESGAFTDRDRAYILGLMPNVEIGRGPEAIAETMKGFENFASTKQNLIMGRYRNPVQRAHIEEKNKLFSTVE